MCVFVNEFLCVCVSALVCVYVGTVYVCVRVCVFS